MKLFLYILSMISIGVQAQIEDCITVQGVVKSSTTKEILPNSRVYVYSSNKFIDALDTDEIGAYKLIYSPESFKNISIQVKCFDQWKTIDGEEENKYAPSKRISLADVYYGKPLIIQDIEIEDNGPTGCFVAYPYFDFNSYKLSTSTKLYLNGLVETLNENPKLTILITGHALTTEKKEVAIKRAEFSMLYLASKGIRKTRLVTAQNINKEGLGIEDFKFSQRSPLDSIINIENVSKRVITLKVLSTDGIIPQSYKKDKPTSNSKFVYGKVIDSYSKKPIRGGVVKVYESNASEIVINVDQNGYYYFEVEKGKTYQIQASSDKVVHHDGFLESIKYLFSERALIVVNEKNIYHQDLALDLNVYSRIQLPELTFPVGQSYLIEESKLKLNGLIEVLKDNPIVNLEYNYAFNSFEKNETKLWKNRIRSIQNYLFKHDINPLRFSMQEKPWNGKMSNTDSTKILELLPDFEFPKQLNPNSFKKLKKKEKEILKYWFTKVRFTLKRNSGSNVKDQVLVKGTVWDAFESKPKSNIDLIVQSNGSVVDTIQTDENGKYWFIGSRQQNYQVALGRQTEAINCKDLKSCSSEIVKDFVWLNPHQYNAEEVMVYGFVKDLLTKELVGNVKVVITGSDGSNRELITGKYGVYYFSLDRNTTYQIQATSDEKEIGLYENELYKYFGSEKVLTSTIDNYHSRRASLYLERVMRCYFYLPVYNFEDGIFDLDDSNKLKLNGLIETMNDNPTLVLKLGFREFSHHNQDSIINRKRSQNIQNYLIGKGIDNRRLEYNSNLEPLIITKEILKSSGFYPQLNLDQKITKEVYETFNTYTKSYIDKYIGNSVIEVVRTDFKP